MKAAVVMMMLSASAAVAETRAYDPVPLRTGAVSATDRDPAPMSLRPDVSCINSRCQITMKGWDGANTSLAATPLPFEITLWEGDDWIARPMASEDLSFGPEGARYGWQLGWEEGVVDIFVTPEAFGREGFFIVEQRAGFETVRQAQVIYEVVPEGRLIRHLEVMDTMGPVVSRLEATEDGVIHFVGPYEPAMADVVPETSTRYWWAANDHGETLMTWAEMYDAGVVETSEP